jgi:hypothetical protein
MGAVGFDELVFGCRTLAVGMAVKPGVDEVRPGVFDHGRVGALHFVHGLGGLGGLRCVGRRLLYRSDIRLLAGRL